MTTSTSNNIAAINVWLEKWEDRCHLIYDQRMGDYLVRRLHLSLDTKDHQLALEVTRVINRIISEQDVA